MYDFACLKKKKNHFYLYKEPREDLLLVPVDDLLFICKQDILSCEHLYFVCKNQIRFFDDSLMGCALCLFR